MKAPSLITLLLIALVMFARADDKPKSKESSKTKTKETDKGKDSAKGKEKSSKSESGKGDNGLESIGSLIPEGVKKVNVKIPGFDQGRPSSLVTADTMTRVNPNELYAEGVVIHLYGKEPKSNMRVDMKTATYHLDTKILVSDDRSKVTRSDFTVEGDHVVYDTTTSKGTMKGNVHMVIYNASSMAPKQEEKPTGEEATPATEASTPTSNP